jgi:hypothetical protein
MKFHGNPSSGSRSAKCEQVDRRTGGYVDRREEMTKIIGAFGDRANAPKRKAYCSTQKQTLPVFSITKYNPHPHNSLLRSFLIL